MLKWWTLNPEGWRTRMIKFALLVVAMVDVVGIINWLFD